MMLRRHAILLDPRRPDRARDQEWRLRIAQFGDGYQQRTLDGINALDLKWSLTFDNRERPTCCWPWSTTCRPAKGAAFPFHDPATGDRSTRCSATAGRSHWGLEPAPERRTDLLRHAVGRVRQGQRGDGLMGVRRDVSQLAPLEIVEMFVWDDTPIGGATVFRWHPGTTVAEQPIVWQGVDLRAVPDRGRGLRNDRHRQAAAADPARLQHRRRARRLSAHAWPMALGAKVTRKRTLGKYLDAVNFPGGNPYADPNTGISRRDLLRLAQGDGKPDLRRDRAGGAVRRRGHPAAAPPGHRRHLPVGLSLGRVRLCRAAGPGHQRNPTSDPAQDACRKTLTACKARFGECGVLRTSAFPGLDAGEVRMTWQPTEDQIAAALAHAAACQPLESCGVIAGGRYRPLNNTATAARRLRHGHARLSSRSSSRAQGRGDRAQPCLSPAGRQRGRPRHVRKDRPAVADRLLAARRLMRSSSRAASGRRWSAGNGRGASHDCFGLIRDGFQDYAGIRCPTFARDWMWWQNGGNIIADQFAEAGFVRLPPDTPPQHCDVFGMKLHAPVVNHLGLFLAPDVILHQLMGRLSVREVYGGVYRDATVLHLRHEQLLEAAGMSEQLATIHLHGPLAEQFGDAASVRRLDADRGGARRSTPTIPASSPPSPSMNATALYADGDWRDGDAAASMPFSRELHLCPMIEGRALLGALLVGALFPAIAGTVAATIIGGVLFAGLMIGLSFLLAPKVAEAEGRREATRTMPSPGRRTSPARASPCR